MTAIEILRKYRKELQENGDIAGARYVSKCIRRLQ